MTATDGTVQDRRPGAVLVTGGASGLGAAIALAVQDAGGRPFVLDLVAPPFAVGHELVDLERRAHQVEHERAAAGIPDGQGDRRPEPGCAAGHQDRARPVSDCHVGRPPSSTA